MNRKDSRIVFRICLGIVVLSLTAGCSLARKATHSSRSAVEQLLLVEATERSLAHPDLPSLPIPEGTTVVLDVTALTSWEDQFARDMVAKLIKSWLGEQGFFVRDKKDNAEYRVEILTNALGTEYSETFIGMPAFQSILIPFALPELALFKAQYQTGFARYYANAYENETDRFLGSTPIYTGEAYYNTYTVLLIFGFNTSNLMKSPQVGTFHKSVESGKEAPLHTTTLEGKEEQ